LIARQPIPDWIDYSTDGPLATTVADLRLLLAVQSGPAPGDPTALPSPPPEGPTRPGRLYAAPRFAPWDCPLPDVIQSAFGEAVAAFGELVGLPIELLDPETIFATGNPDTDWFVVTTAEHVCSLGRGVVERNLDRLHPGARWFLEQGLQVILDDYLDARRRRFGYVRELDEMLGEEGVVLSPTIAAEGWLAEGRLSTSDQVGPLPAEVYNTSLQNMTGHPALSLPAGRLPNGLPFGLQVLAHGSATICSSLSLAPGRRLGPGPRWPTATNRSTPVSRNRCQATCLGLTLPLTCPGSSRAQLRVDRTGLSADRSRRTGRRGSLDRRH
jgi:Asp-tRNA(Asn)/Glu-tRNA(Gln) amidotransferase A subunit family amidase